MKIQIVHRTTMKNVLFLHLFFACIEASILKKLQPISYEKTQDITTSRANTLFDDADDIQRQLDNEALDRANNGKIVRKKLITEKDEYSEAMAYVAHCPEWSYGNKSAWSTLYPTCCGKAQSPVDLPHSLLKVTGAKELMFRNHDISPVSLTMFNNGRTVKMTGKWHPNMRPFVQGGAVHGRRYLFDSIHLHWPSEHTIGTLHYPVESQVLYVSVEYPDLAAALRATDDNMALLAISTIYTIANKSNPGINAMLNAALSPIIGGRDMATDNGLSFFNPPFKEYASYQGSLTIPPCTESVIWLIRAKSLPVTATLFKAAQRMKVNGETQRFIFRDVQQLNDRNVYFFA